MSTTKIAIIVVVLAIVGIGAYLFTTQSTQTGSQTEQNTTSETIQEQESTESMDLEVDPEAAVFNISAKNFEFSEDVIEVKVGQTVTINLTSEDGFHDFVIDEFNVATDQVNTGQSSSVTFVADQAGEFEFYCSVMQHRQMGMVGTLVVTE